MNKQLILAFESSCDDTSVAIVDNDYKVLVNVISSQLAHNEFGGILPELASRLHMKNILHLTDYALKYANINADSIDAVAVSINPGLIGSLIVGLSFAKGYAWSLSKPLIAVNHILSHIYANFIEHQDIEAPFLALVVSGGHTELVHFTSKKEFLIVGKTLDDAAGETFDKIAKIMGLGYPGGPIIDTLAINGNKEFIQFPRALKQRLNFNFSYSGLKTSVLSYLSTKSPEWISKNINDIAASVQFAIIEPLVKKSIKYASTNNIKNILIGGGVAANSMLRALMLEKAVKHNIRVVYPSNKYCLDNAAMVAIAAFQKYENGIFSDLSVNAFSEKGARKL